MNNFNNKLATQVINSDGYKNSSDRLFEAYVLSLTGENNSFEKNEIKKLLSSSQIFHNSDDRDVKKEGATILSMLLDLFSKKHPDLIPIAFNIFMHSGDFPNIKLLTKKYPGLKYKLNLFSETQLEIRQSLNSVDDLDFLLTDFQRSLWEDLTSEEDVITVAPTSAGKTHIILSYLMKKVAFGEGSFAAVVVPTRALISEVAGKIYELAKEQECEEYIEICTVPKDGDFGIKTFFVMTQERLHEILQSGDISFNYLFIDEAHNIADKSRGVLLHLTIERMLEDSYPQIIISMPSPSYQNSFSSIFKDIDFKKQITETSPVSKVIMSVTPKGKNLVISRHNSNNVNSINKGFKDKSLADIVYKLGAGESNIIYRNQTDHCENVANDIADLIPDLENNDRLEEAADYIENFVHSDFTLARNLRKGVAFHYGPLPSSVRIMVENLVKDDQIRYVACTSTLAEGVNLPAKNLFLKNPTQPIFLKKPERVEDVKIKNITGRAGRMLQHFSGNIFLIEPEKWAFKDYFDDKDEVDEKIPTYFKSLNEEFDHVISALDGSYAHDDSDQYRFYTIANKLIKEFSNDNLENTLNADELLLDQNQTDKLIQTVKAACDNLKITSFTLEANPTVGYIQQNKLFNFLNDLDDFDDWLLPHPKAPELYETILRVARKLCEFGVFIPNPKYTPEYICLITSKWIKGESLKSIISDQIDWDRKKSDANEKPAPSTNTSVRNIITVINSDICFRFSNALRCYQVLLKNIMTEKGLELFCVKLHSYIEIGACDERMVNLINIGLSRESAKEIDDNLASNIEVKSTRDLLKLYHSNNLDSIHAINKKELSELLT